jgi:beta-phosphoglucomutase-like phosphatase (HAD superfamily)
MHSTSCAASRHEQGAGIHGAAARQTGLAPYFDAVTADRAGARPHPAPFLRLQGAAVAPAETR